MVKTEYALVGRKLGHSYSAGYFNEKFAREGISARYSLTELADFTEIESYVRAHPLLKGLNVTIPYKEDAWRFATELTEEAREIGAVNTLRIDRNEAGRTLVVAGTNTDAPGFARALAEADAGVSGKRRALVLGAGGASKAVCHALRKMGIGPTLVSRTPEDGQLGYEQLDAGVMADNLLIVNTTPLGMYPNVDTAPDIPYRLLTPSHFCFDLVYNPWETKFMRLSAAAGAGVSNGLAMLHNQAELSWEFWNAVSPDK